ncbi:hypothetical protein OQA88_1581 [Cercophora sp. LCS_1]
MQFSLTLLGGALLLTQGVLATDCLSVALANIPQCAQSCYLEGAPTIGCDGLDFACQCNNQPAMFAAIEGCVATSCPGSEFEKVIDGSNVVCDCAAPAPAAGGSMTVSGTLVPPSQTVSSIPIGTVIAPEPSPSSGGGDKPKDIYPSKTAPTQYATAQSVSRAERPVGLGLPFALTIGAILAVL